MTAVMGKAEVSGLLAQAVLNWDYRDNVRDGSIPRIELVRFGDVRFTRMAGGACRGLRGNDHQTLDSGSFVGIVCLLDGAEIIRKDGHEQMLSPSDIVVWENSGDLSFTVPQRSSKFVMLMPRDRFLRGLGDGFPGSQWILPGRSPTGALVSGFLTALAGSMGDLDDASAEIAIEMTLDMLGHAMSAERKGAPVQPRTTLFRRIVAFIDRHLEGEDLTPARIAEVHGISIRYLQLVFANQGTTVSGWIRERRLQRCREELELARRGWNLTEIAYNWGFADVAHFSRSFKKRFGVSPTMWRLGREPHCAARQLETA